MKKSILFLALSFSFISLSAQFYLGIKTGIGVNNGFDRSTSTVAEYWQVRSKHFFGGQAGFIGRYETAGLFKFQAEMLLGDEGSNYFIKYSKGSNPNEEYNVQIKRSYLRTNLLPQIGGSFKENSRWRFMGGIGISSGFPIKNTPVIKTGSMEYWPIDNMLMYHYRDFSLLFSATISWKVGIGILEFNPRFRYGLFPAFDTNDYKMPEQFNRAIELNFSFIVPIKLNTDAY